jgi:hypothetical protein
MNFHRQWYKRQPTQICPCRVRCRCHYLQPALTEQATGRAISTASPAAFFFPTPELGPFSTARGATAAGSPRRHLICPLPAASAAVVAADVAAATGLAPWTAAVPACSGCATWRGGFRTSLGDDLDDTPLTEVPPRGAAVTNQTPGRLTEPTAAGTGRGGLEGVHAQGKPAALQGGSDARGAAAGACRVVVPKLW